VVYSAEVSSRVPAASLKPLASMLAKLPVLLPQSNRSKCWPAWPTKPFQEASVSVPPKLSWPSTVYLSKLLCLTASSLPQASVQAPVPPISAR